ncbi:serine/threonine-protein kinase PknG [Stackebrandtia albiflava]|uniref:non-specific serine/threonine protein kinase n=1 Tax=Stackebrandtia albiflava TaxID=406432 RepID=A0A562VBE2_9ACTN|nr:serine/threonine-protein kinase [Stackebrandtia albiflava]TWJ15172.1 serine/threonine-protein kinase PknG [Stackebrandtia albiflava]
MNQNCAQPGCSGAYGGDGYCEECGSRRPGTGPVASFSAPPANVSVPVSAAPVSATPVSSPTGPVSAPVSRPTRATGTQPFTGTTRTRLGGGMKDLPPVPIRNPSEAVLRDPQVPENKRHCGKCGKPVGRRGPQGQPGRLQGFCPHCRNRFSFVPSLQPGDTVAQRYEILGAMAHGGLGWIYLARDRNVGDDVAEKWVVLKGLIDTSDPDAIDSAIAERRFLAALDHPNIVQIYDFVRHPDPRTNEPLNYIVMEYVPGRSLRDLRRTSTDEAGQPAPLPLSQVLTYAQEILPALGYLHQQGLLYCDFKPDNVIHVESWLKLIDLGAVRRLDDNESAVFGTPGYAVSDDEIINHGPSIGSDLYTVARSMAVLAFEFHGFSTEFRNHLPSPRNEPLLARFDSFHRFLLRATHPDPAQRFATAEEMREQLIGVRQEVLSVESGHPQGTTSALFTPEQRSFAVPDNKTGAFTPVSGHDVAHALPIPLADGDDPSAGYLATLAATDPLEILHELKNAPAESPEVRLRRVRTNLAYGNLKAAAINLDQYAATPEGAADWRITWWRGVTALLSQQPREARRAFDALYSHLPGEIAPTLGLAAACELDGDVTAALGIYSRIWQTDRRYISAAFGQARLLAANGHAQAAVTVLDSVPPTSNHYTTAQLAAVALRLPPQTVQGIGPLRDAATRIERLDLPTDRHHAFAARILLACLHTVTATGPQTGPPVLSSALDERSLRLGLEHTYRELARTSPARADRIRFIDHANDIRPWTVT